MVMLALVFALVFAAHADAAHADVAVPSLTDRVVDQTGTLSAGEITALTQKLTDFETRKGSQIAVLIVPTTAPETIEAFSIRVAEAWKIGRKKIDDGAILVVAKNDRRLRIEVGYGLEGALTDLTAKRIVDEEITPKFKSGDFAAGIDAGVDRMIRVIDGEPLPAPQQQWSSDSFDSSHLYLVFILVLFLGQMFRAWFGRLMGAVAAGGVVGLLVGLITGVIATAAIACAVAFVFTLLGDLVFRATGSGRGGWSGGSRSGGGFSGGGGSFGGGGASGRW